MAFVSGAPVYVPVRQFVKERVDVPREAKEEYGANPIYLPAIALDKKGCFKLLWSGSSVDTTVAFPRFDLKEDSTLVEEISDLKHPDCASILMLVRRKFLKNVYGSTMGNRVYLWVAPLRQKVQNSPLLMSSICTLCKKYKATSLTSLKAAAEFDATTIETLNHPYAGMYVRATQVRNDLFREGVSQTICMRGSHGSGKSYSYRLLLQYLLYINNLQQGSRPPSPFRDISDGLCLSMETTSEEPESLFFQPGLLSQSVIAGLRVQSAFGCVDAGSSAEYRYSSRSWSYARIVYSPSQRAGKHYVEKVIFATRLLDDLRLKPQKRSNMPLNTDSTKMPYMVILQFLASLSDNPTAMEQYKIKPAEYSMFMSDSTIEHFTNGVKDHNNHVVHGKCNVNKERKKLASDFLTLKQSLFAIGMDEAMWEEVCKTLAVICHLQSMNVVGVDQAVISAGSKSYLAAVEELIGVENGSLLQLITKKVDKNKFTVVDNRAGEARVVVDSLSGAIYRRLTAFLLSFCSCCGSSKVKSKGLMTINLVDTPTNYGVYEGIGPGNNLDTINHETVPYQSFMDLNAGYLLEWVNSISIESTLNKEMDKYQSEGVKLSVDINTPLLVSNGRSVYMDLFDGHVGITHTLEVACTAAKADDKSLSDNIRKIYLKDSGGTDMILPTRIKSGSKLFRANGFIVRHSYGAVHYDGENFINLNKTRSIFTGHNSLGVELLEVGNLHILKQSNNYNFDNTLDALISADDSSGCAVETSNTTDSSSGKGDKDGYGTTGFKSFAVKRNNPKTFAMRSEGEGISKAINVLFGSQDSLDPDPDVIGTKQSLSGNLNPTLHYFLCVRPVNAVSLVETPAAAASPIAMDSGVVDAQLNALHVPEFAKLLKSKFAEPSRSFQELYEYYKLVLPFSMHSKQSQDAMLGRNANFSCSSSEAQSMVESLCLLRNKSVNVGDFLIDFSAKEYIPVIGKSIIFLSNALHELLEEFRLNTLEVYGAGSKRIQTYVRMHKQRKIYKEVIKRITMVQSHYRMKVARRTYQNTLAHCDFLKFKLLMHVHRRRFLEMKSAINHIKCWLGHKLQNIRMLHLLDKLRFFHSLARAALIKKTTMLVVDVIVRLQRLARLFLFRCWVKNKRNRCALQIQRSTRGYLSRLTNSAIVARIKKGVLQRKRTSTATRLQGFYRGSAVRKRLRKVDENVRVIQQWARNRKVRCDYLRIKFLAQWGQKQIRYIIANNRIHRMLEKKMMIEAARQISGAREKEFAHTSQYGAKGLCIGTLPHQHGHAITSIDAFYLDVFSDLSLAYPDGWIKTVMNHVEKIYLEKSSKKSIAQIAVGSHHTVIVDDRSNVYTFGLGDGGQLGHGKRHSLRSPRCLDRLQTLLSGAELGVVRNSEPSAMRGSNSIPRNTRGTNTVTVEDVCCGREHTILLTKGGRVWSWGSNKFGQLGHSNFEICTCPRQVVVHSQVNLEGGSMSSVASQSFRKIKQIAAGGYHSVALTDAGVLYTWGSAAALGRSQGQSGSTISGNYGYNTRSAYEAAKKAARESKKELPKHDCEPGQPPFFTIRIPIAQVVCGDAHTVVKCTATVRNLRSGVELYAWGNNSYGQLGVGKMDKEIFAPTRVLLPATERVFVGFKSEETEKTAIATDSTSSAPAYGVAAKIAKKPVQKEVAADKDGMITRLLYSDNDMANACLCSGGRHMLLALKGDLWAWGWNKFGQIGDGTSPKNASADADTDTGERKEGESNPTEGKESQLFAGLGDVSTGEDVYSPKRIWRHGQSTGSSSVRGYVSSVTAGWRHSSACIYVSHSSASRINDAHGASGGTINAGSKSAKSRSPVSNNVYMWGALPRSSSLLRNDGSRLDAPVDEMLPSPPIVAGGGVGASSEDSVESKEKEVNNGKSSRRNSVALIRQSKSFVEEWEKAAKKESYSSDDDSQCEGDEEASQVSTKNLARSKSKWNSFEDEPTPYPCQVLMPPDIGTVSKLVSCCSTTFSFGLVATTSHDFNALHVKRGSKTPSSSPKLSSSGKTASPSSAVSPTVASPDRPRTMPPHLYGTGIHSPEKRNKQPLPPWYRDEGATKEITFHAHQETINKELRPMKNFTLPKANLPSSGSLSARNAEEGSNKRYTAGIATESSSSRRKSVAATATKNRGRKEALLQAKRTELRKREQGFTDAALLSLFDPHVAKTVEAETVKNHSAFIPGDKEKKSINKQVLFAETLTKNDEDTNSQEEEEVPDSDADVMSPAEYISQTDADPSEHSSVWQLQYDVSLMSERFIAKEQSRVEALAEGKGILTKSTASAASAASADTTVAKAVSQDGDSDNGDLAGSKQRLKSIKLSQPTAPIGVVALDTLTAANAGSPTKYSDIAFDYNTKLTSPKAKSHQRDGSPLRLAAVRDLAGMIEKIRVAEDR